MSNPGIAPGIIKAYINIFVDECGHFYRQACGDAGFVHQACDSPSTTSSTTSNGGAGSR
jgi:hypothetical protein